MNTPEKSAIQEGWDFAAHLAGADYAAQAGHAYVSDVSKAIEQLEDSINNHPYQGQGIAYFKGYVAEEWHAGTFNVDAIAAGSTDRATVLHSNALGSVDIQLDSGPAYSAKVYMDGAHSAVAQSTVNTETGAAAYADQGRLIPQDQMQEAQATAHRQALRNQDIRPNVAEAYRETGEKLTARVENQEGISSVPKDRRDFEDMADSAKKQRFKASEHGVTPDSAISVEYMLHQAVHAGCTAAAITVAMQMAPEIYKAIDYLIKNGEINVQQLKRMGIKSLSAGAEGFLRGSVACGVLIMCQKGALGPALVSVNATMVGALVAIVMGTVKNSILVAAGSMSARQMGAELADSLIITSGYLVGAKVGGVIGQALGFQLPVVGYLLGSMIGCAFAAVYGIGKKKLISFCVDTGFTCFGLVEQNYEIPEDVLRDMGIDIVPVPRAEVPRTEIPRISASNDIDRVSYETINLTVLRRGVIGVNKIGYTLCS